MARRYGNPCDRSARGALRGTPRARRRRRPQRAHCRCAVGRAASSTSHRRSPRACRIESTVVACDPCSPQD